MPEALPYLFESNCLTKGACAQSINRAFHCLPTQAAILIGPKEFSERVSTWLRDHFCRSFPSRSGGGHDLSGTGPKAGGPHYLARFATEQTVTINTAAAGGNAALLSGEE
jgi:hypothetical protein